MIHIVFYVIFIDYDLSGATGQPIEEGKTFTETQQHTKEDAVENEMVILPPLMEPENGKKEEGKATPAEEGKGDADEEREEASKAEEMVENPFFNGLDEEGSKGLLIKREAEDQEAKEEAEELKEREEEERTRKEHEAEQRVEEEAERQAREREVSCLEIQQNRPSVIVAARSRKRAIEDETNNKDAALKLSDDDVSPAVLEKSEKERMDRAGRLEEKVDDSPEGNLDAKREENLDGRLEDKSDDNLGRDDRQSQDDEEILKMQLKMEEMRRRMKEMEEMLRDRYKEKSEEETTANGHVRGIKKEIITLDED